MAGRVAGKVALVTGAARGIGAACAVRLAEEGADLALLDIGAPVETMEYSGATPEQLGEVANQIRSLGRRALELAADVRDPEQMRGAVESTTEEFDRIDILVAAAGIDSWGAAWELSDGQWDTMIDVNLKGVWQSAKAVAPHMIERESGSMVFVGSVLSYKHNPGFAHYTAAKHGVLGLARAFALELAPWMVRANSVDPTAVATDMILNEAYRRQEAERHGITPQEAKRRSLEWNALPIPWIEPVDVANAVLFLASDEARYITGAGLPVDAGALLK
ncbi:MAG: mycofactocin-coupled SDR family oxidoreductase [Dehalococcoidia bacterium]